MAKDYYRILGLAENAEPEVIRAVFKQLAHRYHPDKHPDQAYQTMSAINEAYQHLSDPRLKARYDQRRRTHLPGANYYQILGVLSNVDSQMIHAAYTALEQKYRHSPNKLTEINQAYKTLSSATRRKIYDFSPISFQGSGFSLWKIYLAYHVAFYVLIAIIYMLVMMA